MGGASYFGDMTRATARRRSRITGGYALDFDANIGLTELVHDERPDAGAARRTRNIDETLTWQRGKHSLSFGGVVFFAQRRGRTASRWCPAINFGFSTTNDPAVGMFTTRRQLPGRVRRRS